MLSEQVQQCRVIILSRGELFKNGLVNGLPNVEFVGSREHNNSRHSNRALENLSEGPLFECYALLHRLTDRPWNPIEVPLSSSRIAGLQHQIPKDADGGSAASLVFCNRTAEAALQIASSFHTDRREPLSPSSSVSRVIS